MALFRAGLRRRRRNAAATRAQWVLPKGCGSAAAEPRRLRLLKETLHDLQQLIDLEGFFQEGVGPAAAAVGGRLLRGVAGGDDDPDRGGELFDVGNGLG